MNSHVEDDRRLDESVLRGTFEGLWPKLEERFMAVPTGPEARRRTDRELLEEILQHARATSFHNSPFSEQPVWRTYFPKQFMSELRRIAGPSGKIDVTGTEPNLLVTVRVPRLEDVSKSDKEFMGQAALDLGRQGIGLRFVDESDEF
jgi:hypothetical protein